MEGEKIKEKAMHRILDKCFPKYLKKHEVPFFKKKVDFIYIDKKNKIYAIELKIKDWKQSINQIDVNQLFAHYSSLGIWHEYLDNVSMDIFEKYGFGLISIYPKDIKIIREPFESQIRQDKFSEKILQFM